VGHDPGFGNSRGLQFESQTEAFPIHRRQAFHRPKELNQLPIALAVWNHELRPAVAARDGGLIEALKFANDFIVAISALELNSADVFQLN
jgi:hypothetical protein